jgi:hypothetical protein
MYTGAQIFRVGAVFPMPRNILSFLTDTLLGVLTKHFPNATRGLSISRQALAALYRFGIWSHERTFGPCDIVGDVCIVAICANNLMYKKTENPRSHWHLKNI